MRNLLTIVLVLVCLAAFIAASFWLSEQDAPETLFTLTPESVNTRNVIYTLPPVPTRTPTMLVASPAPEFLVRVESVNVHNKPSLSAPVIGWVFANQKVKPDVCSDGWAHIEQGWINGTCLTPDPCGQGGSCQ